MIPLEQAIFTNLCMIRDSENRVMLIERSGSWPGLAFPGGHVEPGESFVQSVIREVREETGLEIERPQLCGVKQFPKNGARYVVFMYLATRFTGEVRPSSEGRVFWADRAELKNLPLSTHMYEMIQIFEDAALSEFYWHETPAGWQYELL